MKKIRNACLVVGAAASFGGLVIALTLLATGEWRISYEAKVRELFVCEGLNPSNKLPTEPSVTFPTDIDRIWACGYLETNSPIRLGFLLFFEDEYVCTFVADRQFGQGYFVEPLCFEGDYTIQPGVYRIDIYYARNRLGSTEFVVSTK